MVASAEACQTLHFSLVLTCLPNRGRSSRLFMSIKDQIFLASQYLAPHHLVSRAMGVLADSRAPEIKNAMISRFVRRYQVDMSQA